MDHITLPDIAYGDVFNALCLLQRHGRDLRYCKTRGGWYIWSGRHWEVDQTDLVMECCRDTIKWLTKRATQIEDPSALLKHCARSFNHGKLTAMLAQASSLPALAVMPTVFDADPWLLNCANGTLDLRYGFLQPHVREDMISRYVPVDYIMGAKCPTWDAFLWRVMGGPGPHDDGSEYALLERHERATRLVAFLKRAVGYALTGMTNEDCLFVLYGSGKNGKSKFLDALHTLLGAYARSSQMSTFLHQEKDTVRNDLADLAGVRLVSAIETSVGQKFSEGLIKQLTGGDRVKARFLFREYFEFLPHFKLFLAFNHKPEIKGSDLAIWERINMVPFDVFIPPDERDKNLSEKFKAEMPGILAWAIEGCMAWQIGEDGCRSGLQPPQEVVHATAEYREEMDRVGAFLRETCLINSSVRVKARDLYVAYQAWCGESGEQPTTQTAFGRDLTERGHKSEKVSGVVWRLGIAMQ